MKLIRLEDRLHVVVDAAERRPEPGTVKFRVRLSPDEVMALNARLGWGDTGVLRQLIQAS